MSEKVKIDSLKKVSIKIAAGTTPETMDLTVAPAPFEFIFGTGVTGITPFEYQLANKTSGDRFQFNVRREDFHHFFEHFSQSFCQTIGQFDCDLYIQGYIENVSTPSNREIIKAMAGTSGCDDGCCGDGCCSH